MNKLFWQDPYLCNLNTKVLTVNENEILFDNTIVYSFAGAQESDLAWINDMQILGSRIDGHLIYYTLPDEHGLNARDEVKMRIDWMRRSRLMRLHFAAELILEIVTQQFGLKKIGAHIAENKARIDFESDDSVANLFPIILAQYNKIISQDLLIHKDFADLKNQRRFWKIDGFAQVPCGGTHVNSTGEVGYITLSRDRLGKSKERIIIKLINTDAPKNEIINEHENKFN